MLVYFLLVNFLGYIIGILNVANLGRFAPIFILIAGFQVIYFNFYKNLYVFSVNLKSLYPQIYAKLSSKKMKNGAEIIKIKSFFTFKDADLITHPQLKDMYLGARMNLFLSITSLISGLILSFLLVNISN